jgi:hypothetical protein
MPLLDHFRPPLTPVRHWEAFHSAWAGSIADVLNRRLLPDGYFAEEQVSVGGRVEIDVATFADVGDGNGAGPTAVATAARPQIWTPPAPALVMPGIHPQRFEVLVYREEGGATLVAAVELISPGNKDRPDARRVFAAKCAALLSQDVGLLILDVVTTRHANLHNELVRLMDRDVSFLLPDESPLYAVAYRPTRRGDDEQIDMWPAGLNVGQKLPLLPLALGQDLAVPLDLEAAYVDACQRRRINVP